MSVSLALKLAIEYHRLLDEGWEPDLEEFLGRVPDKYREECREQIETLTASGAVAAEPEPAPVVEEPESAPVVEEPAVDVVPPEPVAAEAPVELAAEEAPIELAAEETLDESVLEGALEFSLFEPAAEVVDEQAEEAGVEALELDEPVVEAEDVAAPESFEVTDEPEVALAEEAGVEALELDEPVVEVEEVATPEPVEVPDEVEVVDEPETAAAEDDGIEALEMDEFEPDVDAAPEPTVEAEEAEVVDEPEPDVEVESAEEVPEPDEVADTPETEEAEADEPPRPALLRAADELRQLTDEIAEEAQAAVEECVDDLAGAVGVEPEPAASELETVDFSEVAPYTPDDEDEPEFEPEFVDEQEAAEADESPAKKGPQRLSKAEAMALWDKQLARLS